MVDIQCPTTDIWRENKKRRKKKPQEENIYICPHPAVQGGHKLEWNLNPLTRTVMLLQYLKIMYWEISSQVYLLKSKFIQQTFPQKSAHIIMVALPAKIRRWLM